MKLEEKKQYFVKKNPWDVLAVIYYSIGCSLLHLAMFIAIFFVEGAHMANANAFDKEYKRQVTSICGGKDLTPAMATLCKDNK